MQRLHVVADKPPQRSRLSIREGANLLHDVDEALDFSVRSMLKVEPRLDDALRAIGDRLREISARVVAERAAE